MKKQLITFFALLCFSRVSGNDINWSFPPVTLSSASVTASSPHVAIDANGNVVAAWLENGFVKASTKLINTSWSAVATVSSSGASAPQLVSDINGNATLIWIESGIVKAATKPFGGSWSSATALSGASASTPSLAVDKAGDVIAAWARSGNIETSTKLYGQSWQATATINGTSATSPQIAIGGTGSTKSAVVVWTDVDGSVNAIYASNKAVPGSWSAKTAISRLTHNAGHASAQVDTNGNAVAVWFAYDTTGTIFSDVKVESSYLLNGGSWNAPTVLSAPGVRDPSTLVSHVAFDAIGNAVAVWNTSYDDITYNIESAVKPIRGNWTNSTVIVNSNLYAFEADLSVSSLGDALVVYMFYNGSFLLIQSSESDFTGLMNNSWSVPINLSSGANHGFPKVAASLAGEVINAAAVWVSTNGTYNIILATTGSRNVVLHPTNLAALQSSRSFGGVFTEYYNTLSWHASTSPNVVGYIVFRNGTPIAEVDANVLSFVDDNRIQDGSEIYGVAAIDNQGSQSTIPTVSYP
jgi:hypothetical protein